MEDLPDETPCAFEIPPGLMVTCPGLRAGGHEPEPGADAKSGLAASGATGSAGPRGPELFGPTSPSRGLAGNQCGDGTSGGGSRSDRIGAVAGPVCAGDRDDQCREPSKGRGWAGETGIGARRDKIGRASCRERG